MPRFRPRLTFSLRTMLVLVTILCIWLGYHLNWIRQRREALAWVETHGAKWWASSPWEPIPAPMGLRLLGQDGVSLIDCDSMAWRSREEQDALKQRFATYRQLFPEAIVTIGE
jgi:hypothetical protein